MRVDDHPVLGAGPQGREVTITVDGNKVRALEGEMVAAALAASGMVALRYTSTKREPRGVFCAIGRCTDCAMVVNGRPNVRTCVTPVEDGMVVDTQTGLGVWKGGE